MHLVSVYAFMPNISMFCNIEAKYTMWIAVYAAVCWMRMR